jgi:hypothetical protein
MFERVVIPNRVRDLTKGHGLGDEICVSKTSSGGLPRSTSRLRAAFGASAIFAGQRSLP